MLQDVVSWLIDPATWTARTWSGSWAPPLSTDVPAGHAMPSNSVKPASRATLFVAIL